MRIAQIAPLQESVPPARYGGTERVVSVLTEELVRRGHEVTLFATGDSKTSARLVPVVPQALRPLGVSDYLPATMLGLGSAFERASEFDVIHSHVDVPAIPFARFVTTPVVFTMHGRLDLPWLRQLYDAYTDVNLVSVSNNQRRLLPRWHWLGTVYNGINLPDYNFHARRGEYLAFLGRIAPDKGVEEAITVAHKAGLPLRIAAKVDPIDREYYEQRIVPLLTEPGVEFIGEVDQRTKGGFLGGALALLFPIRWPEPFGLVMAEALATGTPVIAGRFGSVPEVVEDGVTGFICDSEEEMVLAVERVGELDRAACRQAATARFDPAQMAAGYEVMYRRALGTEASGSAPVEVPPAIPRDEWAPSRNGAVVA